MLSEDTRRVDPSADGPSIVARVSNEMVRLHKEQFGRGPTRVQTHWAGPDALMCLLEESLTPAERRLVKMGEHHRLRDTRMYFQYASENEFRSAVEQITGRKVRAFISGIDTASDVSCDVFYFEPRT